MEWTENHDVLLLREIMISDLFTLKKGSVQRGERWEEITAKLNQVSDPRFNLKDKRAVRDRWTLLQKKYKAKLREEEKASGISVDDLSEKDVLLEELIEKEESTEIAGQEQKKNKEKEKGEMEDVRKKALERYSETKKRKAKASTSFDADDDDEDEIQIKPVKRRRRSEPLVDFLAKKAEADKEIREKEISLKQKEQEQNQRVIQSVLDQQQQMSTAMLSVIQKIIDK